MAYNPPTYYAPHYFAPSYFGGVATPAVPDPPLTSCGTDIMSRGMSWLSGQMNTYMSQPIIYKRGTTAIAICATIGRTLLKLNDGDGGIRMEWTDRDFLIPASSLVLSGNRVTPERGDLIKETKNGILYTFEVLAPNGEPPWLWSDTYRNTIRIYAKLVKEETA